MKHLTAGFGRVSRETLSVSLDDGTVDEASTIHGSFEAHNTGEPVAPLERTPRSRPHRRPPLRRGNAPRRHQLRTHRPSPRTAYHRVGRLPAGSSWLLPPRGPTCWQFDLVSEGVAWFETNGTIPADLPLTVRG